MILYLRSCFKYFVFSGLFSIFINTLYLTFSLYMLAVYRNVLANYSMPTLYALTAIALTALVVLGLLEFCRSRLLVRAGIQLDKLLSRRVLKAMLKDLCRADSARYTKGLNDINTLRNYLGGNSIFAFFDLPWIFIYLWVIYLVHPLLGLTATGGAVVVFIIGLLQSGLTQKDTARAQILKNQGVQWVAASFRTARELESMGMTGNAASRYCQINDQEIQIHDKTGNVRHILGAVSQSFGTLMQVIIYGVGAALVLANKSDPGVIIAASIIMGRALAPVNQAIAAWKQTSDARTAYDNLSALLKKSQQKPDTVGEITGALDVADVSLSINETQVLSHIDFALKPGEIMGLVGPNGAGKTSLCRMILGMWKPDSGVVELDGKNVFELDNDDIGQYLGYLPQNVELFAGSVKDNIARMGQADGEKILQAAHRAGAHEVILTFPQGYDTDIGEAGRSLSGGQRQRVGLARALYGTPKLVILDEPNSNLDEAGEQALIKALKNLKQMGATTIMITHKPNLLYTVDKILVLQQGQQVRFGDRDAVVGQLMGGVNATHN
ncbi:MAG: type I secretion system permease/ATPase [Desulfobacter postgatei]|uniref:type I secretion system permease/ATPase n=1 Tax=Desulfobacter postgatei TaxID=2293 RepID=UPI0023F089D3|nr:type I secretion system permease/ATPase [Desulfobacter postgatei]MDD4275043.1 type I secretion system permease/ATPase [Desulfobacter postgatei]